VARFHERRAALAEGIREDHPLLDPRVRRRRREGPKRTCVLSDVHANLPALDAVLQSARELGADSYLFLGDAVGYGPHPSECIQRVAEWPHSTLIRGNHDNTIGTGLFEDGMNRQAKFCAEWTRDQLNAEQREWLHMLPTESHNGNWLAVHGAPRDPNRFLAYVYELTYEGNLANMQKRDLLLSFYGHTHVQFVYSRIPGEEDQKLGPKAMTVLKPNRFLLINPGSVGQPRDGDSRAACSMWDRKTNRVTPHRAEYPLERTIADLRKAGLPNDLVYRLEIGR